MLISIVSHSLTIFEKSVIINQGFPKGGDFSKLGGENL